MQETQVQSLSLEDALEEGMATHSSRLAWRIPWTEEPGGLQELDTIKRVSLTHSNPNGISWWLSGKKFACQCRRQVRSILNWEP